MAKLDESNLDRIDLLVKSLSGSPIQPILVAAAGTEEIQSFAMGRGWDVLSLQADATVVKTMIRSNPGILALKDGEVLAKYHHNNTPEAGTVLDLYIK